jgi:hypothetical protein
MGIRRIAVCRREPWPTIGVLNMPATGRRMEMRASSCASVAAFAVALCGCSGVKVRDGAGNGANDIHGIPFYVKVPWSIQETSLASREMLVVFTVTEVVTGAETKESKEALSTKLPVGETLRLDDTPNGRAAIDAFLAEIEKKKPTYEEAIDSVKTEVSALGQSYRSMQPETAAHCNLDNYDLVANSWSTKMLAGTKLYYIEPQNPFIGSASADRICSPAFRTACLGSLATSWNSGVAASATAAEVIGTTPWSCRTLLTSAANTNSLSPIFSEVNARMRSTSAWKRSPMCLLKPTNSTKMVRGHTRLCVREATRPYPFIVSDACATALAAVLSPATVPPDFRCFWHTSMPRQDSHWQQTTGVVLAFSLKGLYA